MKHFPVEFLNSPAEKPPADQYILRGMTQSKEIRAEHTQARKEQKS